MTQSSKQLVIYNNLETDSTRNRCTPNILYILQLYIQRKTTILERFIVENRNEIVTLDVIDKCEYR